MFLKIKEGLLYRIGALLYPFIRPRMITKKKNFQGKKIVYTAIGNSTFIDYPQKLHISNHTYIGHHNFIEASHGIEIGEGCQITDFVSITTHSSHISIRLYGAQLPFHKNHIAYVTGSIKIGKYTFIGPHTVIMPQTVIGKGCIVTAYSYVKGNFPDFSIISGNPAKVVGDTRTMDKVFLDENPHLKEFYKAWSDGI